MDKKKEAKRLSARQSFIVNNYCNKLECEACPLKNEGKDGKTTCESTVLQDKILELEFGTKKEDDD